MAAPTEFPAKQAAGSSGRTLKKRLYISLGMVLVLAATPFAVMQVLGIRLPFYLIDHPTLFFSAITYPENKSTPYVRGNIRAVSHLRDSLWIGGDAGLLAHDLLISGHRTWRCYSLSNDYWRVTSCDTPPAQAAPTVLAMEWFPSGRGVLIASNSALYATDDGGDTWSRERDLSVIGRWRDEYSTFPSETATADQTKAPLNLTIASVPLERTTDGRITFTAPATPTDCATLVSKLLSGRTVPFTAPSYFQLSPSCVAALGDKGGPYFYLKPNDLHSVWEASTDGTFTDIPVTAPSRPIIPIIHLPAPWYLLVLLSGGILLYRASKARVESEISLDDTIANLGVSDRPLNPGDDDAMGFHAMARGISLFLRNVNTGLPLVLAINGAWGSGKSSLMNLISANMETSTRMVWFNAWHHQSEEQLLAALLQAVRVQSLEDLWSLRGMTRRLQLLLAQLSKNWPITTLLSFLIVALLMLIVHIIRELSSEAIDTSHLTTQVKLWAALISSVVALAGTFKKLKTSVGALIANPASLLASYSGSVTIADLSAQTTFRQRFSNDFKKLINVLGDRRLVIIIDDLDRCRPEKIREVMEAVNFLVTSGDCAIILGLARPYVEHFLGVAFKEFVKDMPPDLVGLDPAVEWKDAKVSRTFAEIYLEKLIQIDITIPTPNETQASAVIIPRLKSTDAAPVFDKRVATRILKRSAREASLRALFRLVDRWAGPVLGTLILASALAYAMVQWKLPVYERIDRALLTQKGKANGTPSFTTLGGIRVELGSNNLVLSDSKDDSTIAPSVPANPPPEVTSHARPLPSKISVQTANHPLQLVVYPSTVAIPTTPYLAFPENLPRWLAVTTFALILLAFLAALLRVLLTTIESLKVNDSPEFQRALLAWMPLIHSVFHSPRSLKRYINKVRFLAMRQRGLTETDPIAPADRLVSMIANRLYPRLEGEPDVYDVTGSLPDRTIPDDILIVLVALQSDDVLWSMLVNRDQLPEESLLDNSERQRLSSENRVLFKSLADVWPLLRDHLADYIALAGNAATN